MDLIILSDVHGRILSGFKTDSEEPTAGLDRLCTYIKRLRQEKKELFVLNNGDAIQGTPLVDLYSFDEDVYAEKAHPINILHDYIKLDCFIPGNHEFNFGLDYLKKVKAGSSVPWLAANIYRKNSENHLFQPYHIFTYKSLTIGVIGLVTDFIPKWENDSTIGGLDFRNAVDVCRRYIPIVRPQCDFLIVAYHGGLKHNPQTGEIWSIGKTSENQALDIWESSDEIDLLITGHQHRQLLYQPDTPNRSTIIQPSSFAKHWVHVEVQKDRSTVNNRVKKCIINPLPGMTDALQESPDPAIAEILSSHIQITEKFLNTPLGTVDPNFNIDDPMADVWLKKHPLIQWINDLMCQLTGVEISAIPLLNPNLKGMSGQVTIREVLSFFFFQDTVCVMEITGTTLKQALEKSAEFFKRIQLVNGTAIVEINPDWKKSRVLSYNYDIWEGIDYIFDIRKPIGNRLVSVKHKGSEIEDKTKLQVAVTSYRSAGAFYRMFSPQLIVREFPVRITDLMINDLQEKKHLTKEPIQNFKIIY